MCHMVSPSSCGTLAWQGPGGFPLLHSFSALTDLWRTKTRLSNEKSPTKFVQKLIHILSFQSDLFSHDIRAGSGEVSSKPWKQKQLLEASLTNSSDTQSFFSLDTFQRHKHRLRNSFYSHKLLIISTRSYTTMPVVRLTTFTAHLKNKSSKCQSQKANK